ncbi:hypothetical protein OUZ56_000751 [Daphnia magna]|uniref:Uncharacterized protein n=1 Tax=Daphnia magna TaxID=35525 RepID=A0ABR0A0M8_9CRUS|nr:hypothetical protein OUZ56_000751 [Daphnia magna]
MPSSVLDDAALNGKSHYHLHIQCRCYTRCSSSTTHICENIVVQKKKQFQQESNTGWKKTTHFGSLIKIHFFFLFLLKLLTKFGLKKKLVCNGRIEAKQKFVDEYAETTLTE